MQKGVLSVLSLFLVHLITGTGFMWGSLSSYLISYLRMYDDTLRIVDGFFCMGLVVFFMNSTATLGVYFEKRFGYRKLLFIAVVMIEVGYVFIFFSTSIYVIYISLILIGLFSAQIFVSTVRVGWKIFPEKKGLVSGIILGGLGLSPVLFNLIAQGMINPNNENPSEKVGDDVFYSQEISQKVPKFFITLIILIASLFVIALIFIQIDGKYNIDNIRIDNVKSEGFQEKLVVDHASDSFKNVNEPLTKALLSKNYIFNLSMGMLESFFFYTIYNVCKPFGLIQKIDEELLFILVNVFAFINGSSRMLFGYLYDKLGFKILYRMFLIVEVLASASIYFLSQNSTLYFIVCCISALCMGGGFAVFPSHLINVFGMKNGSELYAILTIAFGVSNLASPTIAKFVVKSTNDYIILFTICAILAFIALIICQFFITENKFEYNESKESSENTREGDI